MFTFRPPEAFEILKKNNILQQSSLSSDTSIVVVSVFGSSHLTGSSGFKRAFRLAIDSFGSVNLFQNDNNTHFNQTDSKADLNKNGNNSNNPNTVTNECDNTIQSDLSICTKVIANQNIISADIEFISAENENSIQLKKSENDEKITLISSPDNLKPNDSQKENETVSFIA